MLALVVVVHFVLIAPSPSVHAAPRRLAFGADDSALWSALSVALPPHGLELVRSAPALSDRATVDEVRARANEAQAEAVVWLCDLGTRQSGLCLYQRQGDQILTRHLPTQSPLSPIDAAGVALSVEVLLASNASSERPATPESLGFQVSRPPAPPPPGAESHALTLEVTGGARFWQVGTDSLGVRVGVAALYAPDFLSRRLGFGLGLTLGPDLRSARDPEEEDPTESLNLGDVTFRTFARYRMPLGRFWLEAELGPAVHILTLSDPDSDTKPPSTTRAVLAIDGGLGLSLPLGRFFASLRVGGFYLLQNDPYFLEMIPAINLPAMGLDMGLAIGAGLP